MQNRSYWFAALALLVGFLFSCSDGRAPAPKTSAATRAPEATADSTIKNKIVPGERLGLIALGLNADSLETRLGRPDASDAAMGKAWLTWKSKQDTAGKPPAVLNIYTAYKDTSLMQKTVQQIRATSPVFKTATGVHTGTPLSLVQQQFPNALPTATYTENGAPFTLYDDVAAGIAFEINDAVCKGIIIHPKALRADGIYSMLHPHMKQR